MTANGRAAPAAIGTVKSRLAKVQRGRITVPHRYVIYGPEGVGKTTLAASAPAPIWIDIDDGSAGLAVDRYTFRDGPGGHVPTGYDDVTDALDDLRISPHVYKTLVVDTADKLEALIWRYICDRDSKKSIEDYGYGKGYQFAIDEWRTFCGLLDRLRLERSMDIVVLAHATIRTFKNPEGADFDRYQLRLHDKAAGLLKEWADVAGFACYEEGAAKDSDDKRLRAKGYSTGKRLLRLQRTAAFDAKSRLALPAEIEIDTENPWAPLAAAVAGSDDTNPAELQRQIAAEWERIGDPQLQEKAAKPVADFVQRGDVGALSRYLIKLKNSEPKGAVQ